jgi:hypothetical protein
MSVIELDLDAPASASSRPPARLFRPLVLALAVVLALALGGSAPPAEPALWRDAGTIPLTDPGAVYALSGDRIYTVVRTAGGALRVAAWTTEPLREAWAATVPAAAGPRNTVSGSMNATTTADGLLLYGPTFASSMIDTVTGRVRWSELATVQPVGPGVGVSQQTHFRPGTEYDQASGAPGDLFWSSSGVPHTEPPQRTTVFGIDLTSGRRLWADDERGAVRVLPVPAEAGVIVVASAEQLTRRAAENGTVLGRTALPPARGSFFVEPSEGLLLVRRGSRTAAYAMDTLDRLWESEDTANDAQSGGSCFDLPCRRDYTGISVLDPRTGAPVWWTRYHMDLSRWGDAVIEMRAGEGVPLRLLDRRTGAELSRLDGWTDFFASAGDPLLFRRIEPARSRSSFGVLLPGRTRVQPLGYGPPAVVDCAAGARLVACRTVRGLEVWSYRA